MKDYSSSFTVHGLNWICTSENVAEKIFWTIAMLSVVGFALYMVNGYLRRYIAFDMRTEIRYVESPILPLPTMIFCLQQTKLQILNCYRHLNIFYGTPCNISPVQSTELNYINYTTGETKSAKYIGSGCHVLNENGSLSLLGTGNSISLNFTAPSSNSKLEFAAISPEEYMSRREKVLHVDRPLILKPGKHDLNILQTQISRLALPYATNCTNQNSSPNPFSALYSRATCMQLCLIELWLSQCGDVPDIMEKFIIQGVHSSLNRSQREIRKCMSEVVLKLNTLFCGCPLACHQTKHEPIIKTTHQLYNKSQWSITIVNEDSKITKIIEVPDYTLEDCLGAVGGILGLAIGASSLSIVELVVYVVLCVVRKLY